MQKTILVTGSTDGIGLSAATMLVSMGHHVLLHGRSAAKLKEAEAELASQSGGGRVESFQADLSRMANVEELAAAVVAKHKKLDVLINNAGVFAVNDAITADKLDVRFAVNTLAPYLLTHRLLPIMGKSGRVINLSSAAQGTVNQKLMTGQVQARSDMDAYAQSKLALTMWSRYEGLKHKKEGPMIVSVNPGSMLGTKMVRGAFGVQGGDLRHGAGILCRAALDDSFADASGKYFDNDAGNFGNPHRDAMDPHKCEAIVGVIKGMLKLEEADCS